MAYQAILHVIRSSESILQVIIAKSKFPYGHDLNIASIGTLDKG